MSIATNIRVCVLLIWCDGYKATRWWGLLAPSSSYRTTARSAQTLDYLAPFATFLQSKQTAEWAILSKYLIPWGQFVDHGPRLTICPTFCSALGHWWSQEAWGVRRKSAEESYTLAELDIDTLIPAMPPVSFQDHSRGRYTTRVWVLLRWRISRFNFLSAICQPIPCAPMAGWSDSWLPSSCH